MKKPKYPALPPCAPLTGDEQITYEGRTLSDVLGFWRWAYSNMNDNASRGRFAEYLVAAALGCTEGTRSEWEPYDILWDGIKIEVKSSAYIQSWAQQKLSYISFDIKPTHDWDRRTYEESKELRRQADVYVFCVENCKNQDNGNPNPLDLGQWDFYVLAAKVLDTLGKQESIGLKRLMQLGAQRVDDVFCLGEAIKGALE